MLHLYLLQLAGILNKNFDVTVVTQKYGYQNREIKHNLFFD